MFCIAAINDVDNSRSFTEPLAPTKEAQESRLTQMYGEALSYLHDGQIEKAQGLFQAILQDPISVKAQVETVTGTNAMLQLRYSTLKNLAETFSKQGCDHHSEALECFLQAAAIDGKDVVLWNRLGTLACALGELNVARRAFEEGLLCSPRHWSCMEKLVEILIALGDEAACLSVAKQLLKLSPSHPRALKIQQAIEYGIDPRLSDSSGTTQESSPPHKIAPRGIDLLQPEYFSLSFANKRKLELVHETEQCQKKRKVYSIDVNLPEASWFALVNAVTDVLKGDKFWKDSESILNAQIVVSPGGNLTDEQKAPPSVVPSGLVNAAVKFSIHKSSPVIVDLNGGHKEKEITEEADPGHEDRDRCPSVHKTPEETSREESGVAPVVAEPKVCSGPVAESQTEGQKDVENASTQPRQAVQGEKAESLKPLDVAYDWDQPSQERRSTRLEKLRSCRRLDKEEDGFGQSKDPARALKKTLEPFTICSLSSPASSKFGSVPESIIKEESHLTGTPSSVDAPSNRQLADGASTYIQAEGQRKDIGGNAINEEEEKGVLQFLKEIADNSGIYHVAQQLLERVVATGPSQRKSLSWLLFLEKLTRMWAADRSAGCSLFLAEVYMDMATSATNNTTASKCFNDCNYNVCCLVENASLQASVASTPLAQEGTGGLTAKDNYTGLQEKDSVAPVGVCAEVSEGGNNETNRTSARIPTPNGEDSGEFRTGRMDVGFSATGRVLNSCTSSDMSVLDLKNNWSFWTRFHWLSGRLWVRSGQWEQAYREFERCQSILECQEHKGLSALVLLPHCKLDREISLDRVHGKLYELQIENILKHSAAKMLEQGQYVDLIQLLTPVLLAGKGRSSEKPTWESYDFKRGDTALSSHELKGLDMLVTACEKVKPPNLVLALQCRELRLKLLCRAAGLVEVNVGESGTSSPGDSTFTLLDTELDATQCTPNGLWSKLVADEVQHISRCAALLREKTEELGGSVALPPVLGRTQVLLLTLMCHFVQTLSTRKGHTGLANLSLSTQVHSGCFVDAAIAFCRLQHLHPAVLMEHQIALLVTVHDVLAEYGLCCAGKECEGGEGAFLKMAIKHLGSLELRLKPQSTQKSPTKSYVDEPSETEIRIDDDVMIIEKPKPRPVVAAGEGEGKERSTNGVKEDELANDETQEDEAVDVERKRVELGLDYALDQSFFCLYGLNLRGEATSNEGLVEHQNTNRGDYKTKEQCAGVLQYILPYAKACSRAGLVKLKKVLRAVYKQFSCPPSEILAEKSVDTFLEDQDFDEDKMRKMISSGTSTEQVVNYALHFGRQETGTTKTQTKGVIKSGGDVSATSSGSQASLVTPSTAISEKSPSGFGAEAEDRPYSKVYENLYYLIAQVEDMSASEKWPGFVLTREGEEFVQTNANYFKYDLCYNPTRFESWLKLAKVLDEEVDLLLNDGSKNINVAEWRKTGILAARVELSRCQSRRSLLMALTLAVTPDQKSEVNELLALVYYDSIQNVVPSFDQRRHIPSRDAAWFAACQNSFAHFEVAYSFKPHWTHVFYCGKLSEKLEHSHTKSLSYYRKAVDMNPTTVDPLYRLHASRFKLLCRSRRSERKVLQAVGLHCFLPSTLDKVAHVVKSAFVTIPGKPTTMEGESVVTVGDSTAREISDTQTTAAGRITKYTIAHLDEEVNEELLNQIWSILFDDCAAALQSCFEGELKHFHKARYRLALGLHCRGEDHDLEKAKEELAFCFKTHRSLFTINMWEIDESHLRKTRRKPAHQRVLELGMPESSRKFISCVRKYLIFYLTLCEEAEDLCTLERAYTCLKADRKFSLCLEDISRVALGKYILALARAICQADSEGSTSQTRLHSLLDKMFNLYMEYGISWSDSAGLSLAEAGIMNSPEVAESAIYSYTHRYIQLLEADGRVDSLEVVNERIRKRFKNPKLVGSQSAQVCKHASFAWCRALCTALCSITSLPQEAPPPVLPPMGQELEDKRWDPEARLIVDLQDEFTATSSYEVHSHPALAEHHHLAPKDIVTEPSTSAHHIAGTGSSSTLSLYSLIKRMKNVLVMKASPENMEKATALLRSSYVFYRDSFSGPFPSGINLFVTQPGKLSGRAEGAISHPTVPGGPLLGTEALDISTPRKLLLWAFALVHGRTGSVAEAVKYCEEQAKPRLKKGLSSLSQGTAPSLPTPVPAVTQERSINTDKAVLSLSKQAASQSPLPAEADRGWLPMEMDFPTGLVSAVSPSPQTPHEGYSGPSFAAAATGGAVPLTTVPNAVLSPRPFTGNPYPSSSGTVREN